MHGPLTELIEILRLRVENHSFQYEIIIAQSRIRYTNYEDRHLKNRSLESYCQSHFPANLVAQVIIGQSLRCRMNYKVAFETHD